MAVVLLASSLGLGTEKKAEKVKVKGARAVVSCESTCELVVCVVCCERVYVDDEKRYRWLALSIIEG